MTAAELTVIHPLPQFFLSHEDRERGGTFHVVHLDINHADCVVLKSYLIGRDRRQLLLMYVFGFN